MITQERKASVKRIASILSRLDKTTPTTAKWAMGMFNGFTAEEQQYGLQFMEPSRYGKPIQTVPVHIRHAYRR